MEKILGIQPFVWFVILVFPGLVSMHVYRLRIAAGRVEWGTAAIEGFFYSAINFAILFPLISWLIFGSAQSHPVRAILAGYLVLLAGPIAWPLLWVKVISSKRLSKFFQQPHITAWDAFFARKEPCFVLITRKNGDKVGGYYGDGAYASSFPNDGDLCLSAVYTVDAEGKFGSPITGSKGLLIRKDEYSLIEFFDASNNP